MITTATLGTGQAARAGGSAGWQFFNTGFKGREAYDLAAGAYSGVNNLAEGNYAAAALDIGLTGLSGLSFADDFRSVGRGLGGAPGGGAGARQLQVPKADGGLVGTTTYGYTTANGDVLLRPGLSRAEQAATLRHEGVHSFLSVADNAPLATVRQNAAVGAYLNSSFFNASEEILAEGIASGSLRQGIRHAFDGGYTVRRGTAFETVVTPRGFVAEAGVGAAGLGAAGYGAYQLGDYLFGGDGQ